MNPNHQDAPIHFRNTRRDRPELPATHSETPSQVCGARTLVKKPASRQHPTVPFYRASRSQNGLKGTPWKGVPWLPCCNRLKFNQCDWGRTALFMKILVTGGAGYIGGTVAGLLAEKGNKPIVFDNLSHGRRELLPVGVEFVEGELSDRAALENLFISAKKQGQPFDGVLHFAALIEAGESMVRPEAFFRNNT